MNQNSATAEVSLEPQERQFEQDLTVYKTLLESTRAIPWKIHWESMQFTYIGPQIEALLGWEQDSWVTAEDWASRIHADDRDHAVSFCIAQSKAGVDHEADYRALKKGGGYVWIRDVVHVVRNEAGEVDSLIGFMFDISERKEAEQKLVQLQRELEQLSLTDGLTGIANRRRFDQCLEEEWADSSRQQRSLSMVILDIDYFKQYNDAYGHVDGDECLKRVAGVLKEVAQRPRDLVARFGGEEFILLLPETDGAAAQRLAQACQSRILELGIAHARSAVSALVTASIGVGTTIPTAQSSAREFIETVDRALYAAKHGGRNRIESAEAISPSI